MKHHYENILLGISGGSWASYEAFKNVSDFCKDLLPITGVLSFVIYCIIAHYKYRKSRQAK